MPISTNRSRKISATEESLSVAHVKANLSAVLNNIEKRRHPVTVLRRRKAIAQIIPIKEEKPALYGSMRGTAIELGDIVGPTGEEWSIGDE